MNIMWQLCIIFIRYPPPRVSIATIGMQACFTAILGVDYMVLVCVWLARRINVGCAYVRATQRAFSLVKRVADSLAKSAAWDQQVWGQGWDQRYRTYHTAQCFLTVVKGGSSLYDHKGCMDHTRNSDPGELSVGFAHPFNQASYRYACNPTATCRFEASAYQQV